MHEWIKTAMSKLLGPHDPALLEYIERALKAQADLDAMGAGKKAPPPPDPDTTVNLPPGDNGLLGNQPKYVLTPMPPDAQTAQNDYDRTRVLPQYNPPPPWAPNLVPAGPSPESTATIHKRLDLAAEKIKHLDAENSLLRYDIQELRRSLTGLHDLVQNLLPYIMDQSDTALYISAKKRRKLARESAQPQPGNAPS